MSRLSRLLRTALHPLLLLGTGAAWAQSAPPPRAPPRSARPRLRSGTGTTGRVDCRPRYARVERQTGGEVLRAEPMQRDGREVYRLKVLTADGRVRVMQDDPAKPREQRPTEPKGKGKGKQEDTSRDSDETPPL
jgi:hypothetical protein